MDLLQGIWIIGEMVGELELELVSDLGLKLLWEAADIPRTQQRSIEPEI